MPDPDDGGNKDDKPIYPIIIGVVAGLLVLALLIFAIVAVTKHCKKEKAIKALYPTGLVHPNGTVIIKAMKPGEPVVYQPGMPVIGKWARTIAVPYPVQGPQVVV